VHHRGSFPRSRLPLVTQWPGREDWREVIGESDETLESAYHYGGQLVCHYLRDAHSVLRVHALDGSYLRNIPLPGIASLTAESQDRWAISGRPRSDLMHFKATSFTESGAIWQHDLATGRTRQVEPPSAGINPAHFVTDQVLVTSADGTRVPVFLTRRRDVQPDGQVRVLLYAYGGFDIAVTPWFSPLMAAWVERGGLLAVANLRGGGE
jgi:prolyl oligopeptidase